MKRFINIGLPSLFALYLGCFSPSLIAAESASEQQDESIKTEMGKVEESKENISNPKSHMNGKEDKSDAAESPPVNTDMIENAPVEPPATDTANTEAAPNEGSPASDTRPETRTLSSDLAQPEVEATDTDLDDPAPASTPTESAPLATPEQKPISDTQDSLQPVREKSASSLEKDSSQSASDLGSKALSPSKPPTGRHAIGVSAGLASGIGLAYRHYLTNSLALRLEGGVIATSNVALFSLGITVQQDFLRTTHYRFYGLEALALHKAGDLLIIPGLGAGAEYARNGMLRGLAFRGELVLTPIFRPGEGVSFFTFLPQVGVNYVF